MTRQTVIFVVGPTASGKTDAAIALAKAMNGEIISADSMQLYQGMNIGTATPTLQEQQGVVHHLLDCVPPERAFSVSEYKEIAQYNIRDIGSRGKVAIVCGGTGLYINALLYPLDFSSAPANPQVREKWEAFARTQGNAALHKELHAVDPIAAQDIHPNNVRRVVRALEIYECTGKPKSAQRSLSQGATMVYDTVIVGIAWPRDVLCARCDARVDTMMSNGLLQEVSTLLRNGVDAQMQSMQGIGYRQIAEHLTGAISLAEAVDKIKLATRQFSKRQMTWFKAIDTICWFDAQSYKTSAQLHEELRKHCLGK